MADGGSGPSGPGAISFGPFRLRASLRLLEREGVAVQLGDRAFDILCVLTEHAGQIVSNRELIGRVWGKAVVGAGSLRFHINALRKALAQEGVATQYIKNVIGRGYTFIAPVQRTTLDSRGSGAIASAIEVLNDEERAVLRRLVTLIVVS